MPSAPLGAELCFLFREGGRVVSTEGAALLADVVQWPVISWADTDWGGGELLEQGSLGGYVGDVSEAGAGAQGTTGDGRPCRSCGLGPYVCKKTVRADAVDEKFVGAGAGE